MSPVNSMDYSGKDTVLDVIRKESAIFSSSWTIPRTGTCRRAAPNGKSATWSAT